MSVASRIKEARINAHFSRSELAKRVGVGVSAISNYENAISSPKDTILYKIMVALNVDANFLFQDEMKSFDIKSSTFVPPHYTDLTTDNRKVVDSVSQTLFEQQK